VTLNELALIFDARKLETSASFLHNLLDPVYNAALQPADELRKGSNKQVFR